MLPPPPPRNHQSYSDSETTKQPPRQEQCDCEPQQQPVVVYLENIDDDDDDDANVSPATDGDCRLTSLSAWQEYLQCTAEPMIQSVKIENCYVDPDIVQCLIQSVSTSLTEIVVSSCDTEYEDEDVPPFSESLGNLVRNATFLHTLRVSNCYFVEQEPFIDAVVEVLLRRKSPLRCFAFDLTDFDYDSQDILRTLMSAVVRNNGLERLEIRGIDFEKDFRCVTQVSKLIPSLKVKHLTLMFKIWPSFYYEYLCSDADDKADDPHWPIITEMMIRLNEVCGALKDNYLFQTVVSNWGQHSEFITEHYSDANGVGGALEDNYKYWVQTIVSNWGEPYSYSDMKLRSDAWLERNRKLARWTQDPTLVPRPLWPEAMALALKAGRQSLYLSLLALSKADIGFLQLGSRRLRKRKRPQTASSPQQSKKHCK